jgi:hypothetical protein
MNKWTDLIEGDPGFLESLARYIKRDEASIWRDLVYNPNFIHANATYRMSFNAGDMTAYQYDLNSTETGQVIKEAVSKIGLAMLLELFDKNSKYANKLIENTIKGRIEGLAHEALMEEINPSKYFVVDENRRINNDLYSFWWDYIEDETEIGIFSSHESTPENGFMQIPVDEEEADNLVKDFCNNIKNLGDYITSESTISKDAVYTTDKLSALGTLLKKDLGS